MKWKHRLSNIDEEAKTAMCSYCGFTIIDLRNNKLVGKSRWRCKKTHKQKEYKYRKHLKECCERCGFTPEHICQLDIHHIDNNHFNNEITNLKTLCANCHRLQRVDLLN